MPRSLRQHTVFSSILLNLNGQAGPTLPLAQFRLSLSSPHCLFVAVISAARRSYLGSTGI